MSIMEDPNIKKLSSMDYVDEIKKIETLLLDSLDLNSQNDLCEIIKRLHDVFINDIRMLDMKIIDEDKKTEDYIKYLKDKKNKNNFELETIERYEKDIDKNK